MTYYQIQCYAPVNCTDPRKVQELVASMLRDGWQGCPILVFGESLLTGSHRLAALREISRRADAGEDIDASILDQDVAADVTDIVEERMTAFEAERGYIPEIEYDRIGWLLEDTEYERYRDQIKEW